MGARVWTATAVVSLVTAVLPTMVGDLAPAAAVTPVAIAVTDPSWMYPDFDPTITRYAVHPSPDGTVQVTVSGDRAVSFNGVPDSDGAAAFSALEPGDEISVFIDDLAGNRQAYALYVLPTEFPHLSTTRADGALAPGNLAFTFDRFDGVSPRFEAILDRNGVPVHVNETSSGALDFKISRSGAFTVRRPTTTPGRTGSALVVLDDQFHETRRIETTGLVNSDPHDSVLESDGSRWLTAYEPNPQTGLVDAVIQHVTGNDIVDFSWSSASYASETMTPNNTDYAHINSIVVQPNGDVLASFRHLSSMFLIASQAHDGHQPGDVIWKLGGRDSSFTFPPGDGGPCAQHSASLLADGHVLVFDDGSSSFFGNLCVDPTDPQGPAVERPHTRVVEFALDGSTATPVRTYGPIDRFSWFMGSAAKLENGDVLVGWSADSTEITSEIGDSGSTLWSLTDDRFPIGNNQPRPYISYRAALVPERDGFDPQVTLGGPADGVTVAQGSDIPVSFSCEDRGGSTLQTCDGPVDQRLDTSAIGQHSWQVSALDGSGRRTIQSRLYTVAAASTPTPPPPPPPESPPVVTVQPAPSEGPLGDPSPPAPTDAPAPSVPTLAPSPDLAVRVVPRGTWVGAGKLAPTAQTAVVQLPQREGVRVIRLRLTNVGTSPGRFLLRAPATVGPSAVRCHYRSLGISRTAALLRGWRTPLLAPGRSLRVRVALRREDNGRVTLPLRAIVDDRTDRVSVKLRE